MKILEIFSNSLFNLPGASTRVWIHDHVNDHHGYHEYVYGIYFEFFLKSPPQHQILNFVNIYLCPHINN